MPATSGVYRIENMIDGKIYIGSAVNLSQRWSDHRKTLRGNRHKNRYLQNAWHKFGEDAFVFYVISECDGHSLISTEQAEIDRQISLVGWDGIYNLNPTAGSRLGAKMSAETREKIAASLRGKPGRNTGKKRSLESIARMRIAHSNMSAETRKKMSESKLGVKRRPFTAETRRRMSEARKMVERLKKQSKGME